MNQITHNIIAFPRSNTPAPFGAQAHRLIELFANDRRLDGDVFWLKENAELLSILECTDTDVPRAALHPLKGFYNELAERLAFFPQYYRFLLSIGLDYEDLGGQGNLAERLCDWVHSQGLAQAELSDLQRAEAQRLLARRGFEAPDDGLEERLRAFIARSATFAVPNKKAAYELTHIVFYLSEYGRIDPMLCRGARQSLKFAGLLAFLDQNIDLLAEICIALRFAKETPSPIWERTVMRALAQFRAVQSAQRPNGPVSRDGYHEFLVGNWMGSVQGHLAPAPKFAAIPRGQVAFQRAAVPGPLREISACMYQLSSARSSDWDAMRAILEASVDAHGYLILAEAQKSTDEFSAFFEGFSRMRQSL